MLLVLLLLPLTAMAEDIMIETFEVQPETRWRFFTDGVMGGVSRGQVTFPQEDGQVYARMTGRVSTENNGGFIQAALDLAPRFAPDLILVDVMMPGMDGLATLKALREDPRTAETPVVFMTAKVMPRERERYLTLGAVAVIAKPFDPSTLADELAAIWRDCVSRQASG